MGKRTRLPVALPKDTGKQVCPCHPCRSWLRSNTPGGSVIVAEEDGPFSGVLQLVVFGVAGGDDVGGSSPGDFDLLVDLGLAIVKIDVREGLEMVHCGVVTVGAAAADDGL